MFRTNSPYGFETSSYTGSTQSNAYSSIQDDVSSQTSGLSRPSAKSIYMQRKDYAESITKMMNKFQYRVEVLPMILMKALLHSGADVVQTLSWFLEGVPNGPLRHLLTCDLDGKEVQGVGDCVERLKLMDSMGRVWGQDMLLEVRNGSLLLIDIETKEELERLALSNIVDLQAVMDSSVYNSLLTLSVQDRRKKTTTVFMFQCEELRADYIKKDLSRALSRKWEDSSSLSSHPDTVAGPEFIPDLQNSAPPSEPAAWKPPDDPVASWNAPDYEDDDEGTATPVPDTPREDTPPLVRRASPPPPHSSVTEEEEPFPPPRPYTETDRNVDILNHIFSDLEIFMGHVAAAVAKDQKKNKKKKGKPIKGLPPVEEFVVCLQKIKCGFNLLGELNGKINNPSAPEFVHCLFSTLAFVVSHCPKDLPPTIVAPLIEPLSIRLMGEEATPEEDNLWQSLGDPWNIPSTRWPEDDEDIPVYTLEFYDGWQAPELTDEPQTSQYVNTQESQHPVPESQYSVPESQYSVPESQYSVPESQYSVPESRHSVPESQYSVPESRHSVPSQRSAQWMPPPPSSHPDEPLDPNYMRVIYDFTARNPRELSITKGEIVELLDVSKQWWKVRNGRGQEGFVPNNVLESPGKQAANELISGPPVLTKKSKSAQVKAWLEYKGFSKITVRCLSPLSGSMLLGMTREELKAICPEEGGRVYLQLQAVKSDMALASDGRPSQPTEL